VDPLSGVTAFKSTLTPSVKTFEEKKSHEEVPLFVRKGRTDSPKSTPALTNTTSLKSGGFYPENAKPGIRYQTDLRPNDHTSVIRYEYSGGICPSPSSSSAVDYNTIKKERRQYENTMKEQAVTQHDDTSKRYNYYRARTTSSSLALTDFLYDKKFV
jgi:hypothetical protein